MNENQQENKPDTGEETPTATAPAEATETEATTGETLNPYTIPEPPQGSEDFKDGYKIGYAQAKFTNSQITPDMVDRAAISLYEHAYNTTWDGHNLRPLGFKRMAADMLDAALNPPTADQKETE